MAVMRNRKIAAKYVWGFGGVEMLSFRPLVDVLANFVSEEARWSGDASRPGLVMGRAILRRNWGYQQL